MVPSACKKYAICTGHNFGLLKTNTQSMVFVWICVRCLYMMVSFLYDLYVQSTPFKMGCLQTMFWFLRYFAHCSYFVVSANFGLIFVTSAHCFHVFVPQLTSCFIAVKSLALSLCHKDFFHSNHAHKIVSLIQMLKFMKKTTHFWKKISASDCLWLHDMGWSLNPCPCSPQTTFNSGSVQPWLL